MDRVGGGREGTYVYPWLIHTDVWQKPVQYCKAVIQKKKIAEGFPEGLAFDLDDNGGL